MYRITVPSSVLRGMDPSNFEKVGIEIILDYDLTISLIARRICFVYPWPWLLRLDLWGPWWQNLEPSTSSSASGRWQPWPCWHCPEGRPEEKEVHTLWRNVARWSPDPQAPWGLLSLSGSHSTGLNHSYLSFVYKKSDVRGCHFTWKRNIHC